MRGTRRLSEDALATLFWSNVDRSAGPDGCWLWTGRVARDGRPRFAIPGLSSNRSAARTAYELTFGPLAPGMCVWQRRDEPLCVNPAHLTAGTPADHTRSARSSVSDEPRGRRREQR